MCHRRTRLGDRYDASPQSGAKPSHTSLPGKPIRDGVFLVRRTFSASATAGVDLSPAALLPSIDLSAGPTASGSIGLDLPLQPGKVTDVAVGEKDLSDGVTGSIISKDFHIKVEDCAEPLTIQASPPSPLSPPRSPEWGRWSVTRPCCSRE